MRTKLKHIIRGWPFYFKLDNSSRYWTGLNKVIYLNCEKGWKKSHAG